MLKAAVLKLFCICLVVLAGVAGVQQPARAHGGSHDGSAAEIRLQALSRTASDESRVASSSAHVAIAPSRCPDGAGGRCGCLALRCISDQSIDLAAAPA